MRMLCLLLALVSAHAVALKVADAPGMVELPGAAHPDEDGISVEDVVNLQKTAVVVLMSSPEAVERRQLIRDTWIQPLNRSSEYALDKPLRRSVAVWFAIPSNKSDPQRMQMLVDEGKIHGDILMLEYMQEPADKFSNVGAVLRWLRVAYHERYNFVVFGKDDTFVSIPNLLNFCNERINQTNLYAGHMLTKEKNKEPNSPLEFYNPFVAAGTLVMGYKAAELVSRELASIRHLSRYDATFGNFFAPFSGIKKENNFGFVSQLSQMFYPLQDPIMINGITPEMMRFLATMICDESGKCVTPPLPASPMVVRPDLMFDPHPNYPEPLCDGIAGSSCDMKKLIVAGASAQK